MNPKNIAEHLQAGCAKPSFRESFEKQLFRAERASANRENLQELLTLLDKYPEVARILELLEKIGND